MRKFTLFLAALCCCAMMNAVNYSLTIAGTTVTDVNKIDVLGDGKVSFEPATNTLTLNNATIQTTGNSAIIWSDFASTLTIMLKGTNNYISMSGVSDYTGAIHTMGRLLITSEENPSSVAELKIVTSGTNGAPAIWSYTGDIIIENPIRVNLQGAGNGAGTIYSQSNGKLIIEGATVYMLPCRIRTGGTVISQSKLTSPSDAVIAADGRIMRSGSSSEYSNTTQVVISSLLQKLYYGVSPKNSGNKAKITGCQYTESQTYSWVKTGENITLTAVPAEGYDFYAWYRVKEGDTSMISDENPTEYTVNSTDEVVYAEFEKKTDFVLRVYPMNVGNIAICNEQPTDQYLTFHCTTATPMDLRAIPAYGYKFAGWYKNNESTPFSTANSFTYLKASGNETMYARFEKDTSVKDKVLSGTFTIGNGKTVHFAPGNLQFQPFTNLFRFAAKQNETIGIANSTIDEASIEWYDLFGWGTGDEAARTSINNANYTIFAEWGDNPIVNGGNEPDQWRTLTSSEWIYLFAGRENAEQKWGIGTVDGVAGMILLPDDFPSLASFKPSNSNFNDNSFGESYWNLMEAQGAVFLPLTGFRNGTAISQTSTAGWYWSATPYNDNIANHIKIASNGINYSTSSKYYGQAVRLVQDVQTPGIDETTNDEITNDEVRMTNKVIRNGQLLIERNGKTYNALGVELK